MKGISIIIPVIRPKLAMRCVAAIGRNMDGLDYEIVTEEDTERIGCPKMVKRLVEKTKYNLVLFLGDDTIPKQGFVKNALRAMEKLPDGWGLVGLNDGQNDGEKFATHWLADKRLLPLLDGEFFHTGYRHTFCDNELTLRCKKMGRYIWAKDACILHDHPAFRGEELTGDYERVYSKEYIEYDHRLFLKRNPIQDKAIVLYGTPLDKDMKIGTRTLMYLQKECAGRGWKWTVRAGYGAEHSRNEMADEMLEGDYTHIYFVDADTVPSVGTIDKLLKHDKDIIAGITPIWNTERRWNYQVEEDVPVSACKPPKELFKAARTGGTTILIKKEVFEKLEWPYFKTEKVGKEYKTDDYYFCDKARAAGFEIWIDPTIVCGHWNYVNLLDMFFKEFKPQ